MVADARIRINDHEWQATGREVIPGGQARLTCTDHDGVDALAADLAQTVLPPGITLRPRDPAPNETAADILASWEAAAYSQPRRRNRITRATSIAAMSPMTRKNVIGSFCPGNGVFIPNRLA